MDLASKTPAIIEFGHFGIVPHRRELLADGQPIKLGGRGFDILMVLIDARGEVVSKDALMARVWPGRIIAEKNLHTQISALRTALGVERELIHTVAGRGYQFTGEVRILSASPDERAGAGAVEPEAVGPPTNLPEPVSELIGRDEELEEILSLAATHRLADRRRRHRQDVPCPRGRAPAAAAICRRGLGRRAHDGCLAASSGRSTERAAPSRTGAR